MINPKNQTHQKVKNDLIEETKDVSNLKILIAEDDYVSYLYISTVLKAVAKEILHAKTGAEAIELCKQHPDIDIILMDIKMPGVNGYEATTEIRAFNKDVKIIAQTAFALSGDAEKAIEVGCNDYITKPIDKKLLMKMLNTQLKK